MTVGHSNPNYELLAAMAKALGDLRERFVFVGGCATALLITDQAAAPVRATHDVDVIVAIVTLREYQQLSKSLRELGFVQTVADGDPPFRWNYAGMQLDVMPVEKTVLGFSNPWYAAAMQGAIRMPLGDGLHIRLVTAAHFVATKLVAFEDRGHGDYLESHDLEDVLSVVDGRPELVGEIAGAEKVLREYVASVFTRLVADDGFLNVLPGLIIDGSPATRGPIVLERLRSIARLN